MTVRSGGPGGRHDNDPVDFRRIRLFPTQYELSSKEIPYYSTAKTLSEMPSEARVAHHLDNQFRLLREDLLTSLSKHSILHANDDAVPDSPVIGHFACRQHQLSLRNGIIVTYR